MLFAMASRRPVFESAAMIVTLVLLGRCSNCARGRRREPRYGHCSTSCRASTPDRARWQRSGSRARARACWRHSASPAGRKDSRRRHGARRRGRSRRVHAHGESIPSTKRQRSLDRRHRQWRGCLRHARRPVGGATLLAQIVQTVADAQRSRAPVQALADRVSSWFVPAVIGSPSSQRSPWMIVGPEPRLAYALIVAVSTLIIACPCALGLATPCP